MKLALTSIISVVLTFALAYLLFTPHRYTPMITSDTVQDTWTGKVYTTNGVPF